MWPTPLLFLLFNIHMCTYCLYSDASDAVETHSCVKLDSELFLKSRDASADDNTQSRTFQPKSLCQLLQYDKDL